MSTASRPPLPTFEPVALPGAPPPAARWIPPPPRGAALARRWLAPDRIGRANRVVAWWLIGLSMLFGSVIGLWAFGGPFVPPAWFRDYDDPGRRLLRLAHIAAIMLPILNFHYLRSLAETAFSALLRHLLCWALLLGTVGLPLTLALAAAWRPALYLLPLPVMAVLVPVCALAGGLVLFQKSLQENSPCESD